MGQNAPNYQQFARFYNQPQQTFGPTRIALPYQYYNYPQPNQQLSFLVTLDLPNLSKLINGPIQHDPFWPTILVKLPSYIPNFDGKKGEYPKNHAMTFHLWCSSNSLMDDSIGLRLFQITLTRYWSKAPQLQENIP